MSELHDLANRQINGFSSGLPTPTAPQPSLPTPQIAALPTPAPAPTPDDAPHTSGGDPAHGLWWGHGPTAPTGVYGPIGAEHGPIHPAAPGAPYSSESSPLSDFVGQLESGGGVYAGQQPATMVDKTYGQYAGFQQQYGSGVGGINNYAAQVLAANPRATIGDFYSGYVLGTADPRQTPGIAVLQQLYPAAYANLVKQAAKYGYALNTPLSSMIHGGEHIAAINTPQPYQPTSGFAHPSEWGKFNISNMPREDLPPPSMFDKIMSGPGAALLMLGSAFTGGALTPMINFYGNYLKGRTEANRRRWQDSLKESTARATQEMMEYGGVMGEYTDEKGNVTDPQGLADELSNIARQYGDMPVLHALQQGGIGAAQRLINGRNNWNTDLMKLQSSAGKMQLEEEKFILDTQIKMANLERGQRKDAEAEAIRNQKLAQLRKKREELKAAGVPESQLPVVPEDEGAAEAPSAEPSTAPSSEAEPTEGGPDTVEPSPAAPTAPVVPAAAPAGGKPAGGAPTARTAAPPAAPTAAPATAPPPQPARPAAPMPAGASGAEPSTAGPGQPVTLPGHPQSDVEIAASQLLNGGDAAAMKDVMLPEVLRAAGHVAGQKWSQIQNLTNNSSLRGDALVDQIRQIDPTMAEYVKRIASNDAAILSPSGFAQRLANYSITLQNLAQKVNPAWRAQQYASKQEFRTSFNPAKPVGFSLQRTNRLLRYAHELANDADKLPNTGIARVNDLVAWFQSGQIGDPRYVKFITDWRNFATETQAVMSGSARPPVTLTSKMIDTLQLGATPEMIRQGLAEDLKGAVGAIDSPIAGWHHAFKGEGNPDMYSHRTYAELTQMANMDIATGALPPPLPDPGYMQQWGGKSHYYLGGDYGDPMNWSTTAPPDVEY